jgi:dephospho-CoA kinase
MILGITGRVGTGKTTATNQISTLWNAHVVDLDKIGHAVLLDPTIAQAIAKAFGSKMLDEEGAVIRSALSNKVFSSPTALLKLNDITHPSLRKAAIEEIRDHSAKGEHVVVVGALLIALGLRSYVDQVLVIDAEDSLIQAVVGEKFDKISPHQISRDAYRRQGDVVIENDHETFVAQIHSWAIGQLNPA